MRARPLVALATTLVVVVGVASAGLGQEPRLRRLHRPPAPLAAPAPGITQPEPTPQPPSGGGGSTQPAPPTPPSPPPPLPRTVAVDESEYSIGVSRTLVGIGEVTFNVYNRGMDDHDLAVVDANGVVRIVSVPSRETRTLVAQLGAGQVKIYCSLFAGTAGSHEVLGMAAVLGVG